MTVVLVATVSVGSGEVLGLTTSALLPLRRRVYALTMWVRGRGARACMAAEVWPLGH
jgi:hypothetical protein